MKATKEYFFTKLKENLGGEVDYCCVIDGCYVFHIYHKEDLEIRFGPPIYAVCDPNNPDKVQIKQSMDFAAEVYKQKHDQNQKLSISDLLFSSIAATKVRNK